MPPIKSISGGVVRDEESGLIYSHPGARGGWPRLVAYADKGAPRSLHKVRRCLPCHLKKCVPCCREMAAVKYV
jgi:hypothetical protein